MAARPLQAVDSHQAPGQWWRGWATGASPEPPEAGLQPQVPPSSQCLFSMCPSPQTLQPPFLQPSPSPGFLSSLCRLPAKWRVMLSPCHLAHPNAASPCHPAWAHRQAASCPLPGAPLHPPQSCPGDLEACAIFPEAAHSLVILMPAKLGSSGAMRRTLGGCGLPWTLTR